MIIPLFNSALIEIVDDYDGVIGSDVATDLQKGILRNYQLIQDHLTTSTGYGIAPKNLQIYNTVLEGWLNQVVYWQQYADAGSEFAIEGKRYVVIPWYRIIGGEKNGTKEVQPKTA